MRRVLLGLVAVLAIATTATYARKDPWPPPLIVGIANGDELGCDVFCYVASEDRNSIEINGLDGPIDGVSVEQKWKDNPLPDVRGGDEFTIHFPCGFVGPVWIKFTDSWTKLTSEVQIWVDCRCAVAEPMTVVHSTEPPVAP